MFNGKLNVRFVALLTVFISLFNWGLGLIFGAIFARKIAEQAKKNSKKLNASSK